MPKTRSLWQPETNTAWVFMKHVTRNCNNVFMKTSSDFCSGVSLENLIQHDTQVLVLSIQFCVARP